jgi:transcriptional regulator with XRE-family HTH domain
MPKLEAPTLRKRTRRPPFATYESDHPVESVMLRFGNSLIAAMNAKGLSGSEMARRMEAIRPPHPGERDIGRDLISHWRRGVHLPSTHFIGLICKVLDIQASDLLPEGLMIGEDSPLPLVMETLPGDRIRMTVNMRVPRTIALQASRFLQSGRTNGRVTVSSTTFFEDGDMALFRVKKVVTSATAYIVEKILRGEPTDG